MLDLRIPAACFAVAACALTLLAPAADAWVLPLLGDPYRPLDELVTLQGGNPHPVQPSDIPTSIPLEDPEAPQPPNETVEAPLEELAEEEPANETKPEATPEPSWEMVESAPAGPDAPGLPSEAPAAPAPAPLQPAMEAALPPPPSQRPLAFLAASLVPALALGLGAFAPRLRLSLLSLFFHVGRDRALAHAGRRGLLDAIGRQPGSTLPELAKVAGMSRNNAVYHLAVLERNGLASSSALGRRRHWFPPVAHAQGPLLALLRNVRRRSIAAYVAEHPDCIQRDICRSLGLAQGRVHEQVRLLHEAGLIARIDAGRTVLLRATGALQALRPVLGPAA